MKPTTGIPIGSDRCKYIVKIGIENSDVISMYSDEITCSRNVCLEHVFKTKMYCIGINVRPVADREKSTMEW